MDEFTERDWLMSTDAHAMLGHLFPVRGFHSAPDHPRKLRLYYVALARRTVPLPAVAEGLLRIAEEIADGRALGREEFRHTCELAEQVVGSGGPGCGRRVAACEHRMAELGHSWPADRPAFPPAWASGEWTPTAGWPVVLAFQLQVPAATQLRRAQHDPDLLREMFGNPFAEPSFDPRWRSERVVGIAAKCYEDRDFRALPLLADAIQDEGGPDDHPVVRHCREEPSRNHARGCWALDLVLGR